MIIEITPRQAQLIADLICEHKINEIGKLIDNRVISSAEYYTKTPTELYNAELFKSKYLLQKLYDYSQILEKIQDELLKL